MPAFSKGHFLYPNSWTCFEETVAEGIRRRGQNDFFCLSGRGGDARKIGRS